MTGGGKGHSSAGRPLHGPVPSVRCIDRNGADLPRQTFRRFAMTPLAGFIAAIIAGWIVRDPRRAAATVVVPFLIVLAMQTWGIAAGYGVSPPSTVTPFS